MSPTSTTDPGGPERPEQTEQPEQTEVGDLSYEDAKEELVSIVATLESGSVSLEESMRLWERGEQLAAHCTRWLDQAQQSVDGAAVPAQDGTGDDA